jgi:solute carrier family 25 iron transporter 28/37
MSKIGNFWKGGSFVSLGCGPAHAAFYTTHEYIKSFVVKQEAKYQPYLFMVGGGLTTITHDLVMTPFDCVKQRSQLLHS